MLAHIQFLLAEIVLGKLDFTPLHELVDGVDDRTTIIVSTSQRKTIAHAFI
jgi:hypothetical protein